MEQKPQVGNILDIGQVYYFDDNNVHQYITIKELFSNRRFVVFGGPAPFSRLDTEQSIEYEQASKELLELGVDSVLSIYCQDAFVIREFKKLIKSKTNSSNVEFYGDGDGFFINNNNMVEDLSYQGLGIRSCRWSAVINNNEIEYVAYDLFSEIDKTSALNIKNWLKQNPKK
jgi:peroxiredoxin